MVRVWVLVNVTFLDTTAPSPVGMVTEAPGVYGCDRKGFTDHTDPLPETVMSPLLPSDTPPDDAGGTYGILCYFRYS